MAASCLTLWQNSSFRMSKSRSPGKQVFRTKAGSPPPHLVQVRRLTIGKECWHEIYIKTATSQKRVFIKRRRITGRDVTCTRRSVGSSGRQLSYPCCFTEVQSNGTRGHVKYHVRTKSSCTKKMCKPWQQASANIRSSEPSSFYPIFPQSSGFPACTGRILTTSRAFANHSGARHFHFKKPAPPALFVDNIHRHADRNNRTMQELS